MRQVMNAELMLCDRHAMLLEACSVRESSELSERDLDSLAVAGLRLNMGILEGLPAWALKYACLVLAFVKHERTKLPEVLTRQSHVGQVRGRGGLSGF